MPLSEFYTVYRFHASQPEEEREVWQLGVDKVKERVMSSRKVNSDE